MSKQADATPLPSLNLRMAPAPRCRTCGSPDVLRDAWARWGPLSHDWTVAAVFDHAICLACDTETDVALDTEELPTADSLPQP